MQDVVLWLTPEDAEVLLKAISSYKTALTPSSYEEYKTLERISDAIDFQLYRKAE